VVTVVVGWVEEEVVVDDDEGVPGRDVEDEVVVDEVVEDEEAGGGAPPPGAGPHQTRLTVSAEREALWMLPETPSPAANSAAPRVTCQR
jgi:hypothetical protein